MKEVIFNDDNLKKGEIISTKRKIRALIVDDDNIVTLCNYHDLYLLPGGTIEENETEIEALIRELKEELGIEFAEKDLNSLLKTVTMARNYPIRNSDKTINRVCETAYYFIRSNKKIDKDKVNLTTSEIESHFRIEYVPLNRVLEIVENSGYLNKRSNYFLKEFLAVLKEYLQNFGELDYEDSKEGLIDLHIHSTASDGEFNTNELIEKAIQMGAQAISITDHDTILGYDKLIYDERKIQLISGIELSAYSKIGRMHILGYNFDLNNKRFRDKLEEFHQNSINNILILVDVLKSDYGIGFDDKDIQKLIQLPRNIGRPDLAKLMLSSRIVSSVAEAFDEYLIDANNKVRDVLKKPTYQECFEIIKEAGGVPVLAHPHSLLLDDYSLFEKIREMKKVGLQGIEVYHSNTSKELSEKLIDIAICENLYITGGSDYHGVISKPDIQLFTGRNHNIKIKRLNLVNDLKNGKL